MVKKADTSAKTPKQARTVKLSTIIWTLAVVAAFAAGFYFGISTSNSYAQSVKAEAVELNKQLKDQQ